MHNPTSELIESHIDYQEEQQAWIARFLGSEEQERDFPWYAEFHRLWQERKAARKATAESGVPFKDPRPARFIEEDDVWRLLNDYLENPGLRRLIEESSGKDYTFPQGQVLKGYSWYFGATLPYAPVGIALSGVARMADAILTGFYTGFDDPKLIRRIKNGQSIDRNTTPRSADYQEAHAFLKTLGKDGENS